MRYRYSAIRLLLVAVATQIVETAAFLTTTPSSGIHQRCNHHYTGVSNNMSKEKLARSSQSYPSTDNWNNKQQTSSSTVRLVRCIPNLSRKEAEEAVRVGRVKVDGLQVKSNHRLVFGQTLTLDNNIVHWEANALSLLEVDKNHLSKSKEKLSPSIATSKANQFVYYKYHKPVGVTCNLDKYDRRGLFYALPSKIIRKSRKNIFPVGRLDLDSEGLVLLTNDGQLADTMLQPKFEHSKEYIVEIRPKLTLEQIQELSSGVTITTTQQRGGQTTTKPTKPCIVEEVLSPSPVLSQPANSTNFLVQNKAKKQLLRFVISEGRNRQIRRMIEVMGSKVISLRRIRLGAVSLGKLSSGSIHPLQDNELEKLLILKKNWTSDRTKIQSTRPINSNKKKRRPKHSHYPPRNQHSRKRNRIDRLSP